MKNTLKLMGAGAVLAFVLHAGSAHAVSSTWKQYTKGPNFGLSRALVTSGTTAANLGPVITDPKKNVTVYLKSSTSNVSVTLSRLLSDSTVLDSEAINVGTTAVSRTFASPLPFEAVGISATAGLTGTNNVSATVIQSK